MSKTTYVNGNPAEGIAGTVVTAEFLNALNTHRHTGRDVDGEGAIDYAVDTGEANAYALTLAPVLDAYIAGMPVFFKAANANTGASTLNINGLGATGIKKNVDEDLETGDILEDQIVGLVYDGTNFQLVSAARFNETQGEDVASAATTPIGAATGNYINVTGTTTITAFDSAPAGTRRIVNFTGSLALTHNAASLILPTAANIQTAAGDVAMFMSLGSGNWRCTFYQRANGRALSQAASLLVSQTIISAKVDSNGKAAFASAGTGLSVDIDADPVPVEIAFAAGFDDNGLVNYVEKVSSDTTVSSLTDDATNYLYFKRAASDGAVTSGKTTLPPVYGYGTAGRPGSPASGQLYYDISKRKWDKYDGASWAEESDAYVFYAEAVTSSGSVTSVVNYALNGEAIVTQATLAASTNYTLDHNIGTDDANVSDAYLVCIDPVQDGPWPTGYRLPVLQTGSVADGGAPQISIIPGGKQMMLSISTYIGWSINPYTHGNTTLTASKWSFVAHFKRSWS